MNSPGRLILIPTPLDLEGGTDTLSTEGLVTLRPLRHFVVENPRSARRFLKRAGHPGPIAELSLTTLDVDTPCDQIPALLAPVWEGHDLGLLSEVGCPAIADPGALLVRLAHQHGIRVLPLVGPSSLLLALMASGLEGQRFCFQGYLPVERGPRRHRLQELEQRSARQRETQLFIETPYRNRALFEDLCAILGSTTLLCLAHGLGGPNQAIKTASIQTWRDTPPMAVEKTPTVFLFLAVP